MSLIARHVRTITEDTLPVLSEAVSLVELRKHMLNPNKIAPAIRDTET